MLKQKTNKKGSFRAVFACAALLLLIIVLENISDFIPGLPAVFLPTSQMFTVLKKGAVYALVAVTSGAVRRPACAAWTAPRLTTWACLPR